MDKAKAHKLLLAIEKLLDTEWEQTRDIIDRFLPKDQSLLSVATDSWTTYNEFIDAYENLIDELFPDESTKAPEEPIIATTRRVFTKASSIIPVQPAPDSNTFPQATPPLKSTDTVTSQSCSEVKEPKNPISDIQPLESTEVKTSITPPQSHSEIKPLGISEETASNILAQFESLESTQEISPLATSTLPSQEPVKKEKSIVSEEVKTSTPLNPFQSDQVLITSTEETSPAINKQEVANFESPSKEEELDPQNTVEIDSSKPQPVETEKTELKQRSELERPTPPSIFSSVGPPSDSLNSFKKPSPSALTPIFSSEDLTSQNASQSYSHLIGDCQHEQIRSFILAKSTFAPTDKPSILIYPSENIWLGFAFEYDEGKRILMKYPQRDTELVDFLKAQGQPI